MIPDDPKKKIHATPEFVVRPYEVACERCTAQPWKLCYILSRLGKLAPRPHPARVALAQRRTRYHVYEMSRGRLLKTFADVPNAEKFAREQAQRLDVEDIDAGTAILLGCGPAPAQIDCILTGVESGLFYAHQRFHREVRP